MTSNPSPVEPLAQPDRFEVDLSAERLDLDVAWTFLSTEAYWGRWRTREDFETQVANAWRLAGVYRRPAGYGRVGPISPRTRRNACSISSRLPGCFIASALGCQVGTVVSCGNRVAE